MMLQLSAIARIGLFIAWMATACGTLPQAGGFGADTIAFSPDAAVGGKGDVAKDAPSALDSTADLTVEQDVPAPADGDAAAPDTAAGDSDAMSLDTGSACPGGPGCPCVDAGDCDNSMCIGTPAGNACALPCTDTCPTGFKCALVTGVGTDVQSICVPRWLRLCDPCTTNKDCEPLGITGAQCVDHGADGHFCGAPCSAASDCPGGYACTDTGVGTKQCVTLSISGGLGECSCSPLAIASQLSTTCSVTAKDSSGATLGTCKGTRVCETSGLSACSAPAPTIELCDGLDNDCDGSTDDEVNCADTLPCTLDTCAGAGGCQHAPLSATSCAATSACATGGTCQAGLCVGGAAKDCNDGNPCTTDSCDDATGCTHVTSDGTPCTDGAPCTVGDSCAGGQCVPGPTKTCATGNVCKLGGCDEATGSCSFTNAATTVACDDGVVCTVADHCIAGACIATATTNCDDQNPCTDDTCGATGCSHVFGIGPCDDGVPCTVDDACAAGMCVPGKSKNCDDGLFCTVDVCNYDTGACSHGGALLDGLTCDADGNTCTVGDACKSGVCLAGNLKDCADTSPCTIDSCSGGFCKHESQTLEGSGCDADGSVCTVADTCNSGTCVPGATLSCDDGNPCTADSCAADKGCQHGAGAGSCSDDNACTTGDSCANGVCAGTPTACADAEPCTDDSCNPATGCIHAANSLPCTDGTACTKSDGCSGGACVGTLIDCDDLNPCTTDSCGTKDGCMYAFAAGPCDDGLACTDLDACVSGMCVGAAITCQDGNPCTADACAPGSGLCAFVGAPLDGMVCDADGSVCTAVDACNGGICTAGTPLACDDGNDCTADSCDPTLGCQHAPATAYDLCATGWCVNTSCVAITPPTQPAIAITPSPATAGVPLTCAVTSPSAVLAGSPSYAYSWTRNGAAAGSSSNIGAGTTAQCETWACSVTPSLFGVSGPAASASLVVGKGASESCGNGVDDNCNGQIDEGCTTTWQFDTAGATTTSWVGGNLSESLVTTNCPTGQVATGYSGAKGLWFDHFLLRCQTLNGDGTLGGSLVDTAWLGWSVGPIAFGPGYCASGNVLVRMSMSAGDQLNAVTGYCLTPAQILAKTQTSSAAAGPTYASAGGSTYDVSCPAGSAITGMNGYAGEYPHTVRFQCTPLVKQ